MNDAKPLVSVVMSCYNAEKYIDEAIESMLQQTFKNFEFIIINDGSSDQTLAQIQQYTDNRIKIISRENKGLVPSLNEGIAVSSGKYIARMDADDISTPDRLDLQVKFLESNSDIAVCGGAIEEFNEQGTIKKTFKPLAHQDLLFYSLNRSPLAHPAATIRKSVLVDNNIQYDPVYKFGQDVKLWSDIVKVGKLANLADVVLRYRHSPEQITKEKRKEQKALAAMARKSTYTFINSNKLLLDKATARNLKDYFSYMIKNDDGLSKRDKLFKISRSTLILTKKVPLLLLCLIKHNYSIKKLP